MNQEYSRQNGQSRACMKKAMNADEEKEVCTDYSK